MPNAKFTDIELLRKKTRGLLSRHLEGGVVEVLDLKFEYSSSVIAPDDYSDSAYFALNFTEIIEESFKKERHRKLKILEIGAGSGIASIYCCKRICCKVTALDINANSVENCKKNAKLNHIDNSNLEILQSDLYSNLGNGSKFDVIMWNHPWISDEKDFGVLSKSLIDEDYNCLNRYFRGARNYLQNPGGFLLLGTSSLANTSKILSIARSFGFSERLCRSRKMTLSQYSDVIIRVYVYLFR